jgi:sodium transport system ATP-binding protein
MLQVLNLVKEFGTFRALDGVSFQAKSGEIFGLLGPNGAGKTTAMRIISSAMLPTSGTAKVMGYDVLKQTREASMHLGVLTEEAGLYGRLTSLENLTFYGRLYGLSREQVNDRIEELSELLDMGEYINRNTEGFSKGMRQKIAIARAIIHDPSVLLLDEPTAGLDVGSARTIVDFIKSESRKDRVIVLSTHLMNEAEKICHRFGIINKGKMVAIGTLEELQEKAGRENLEEIFLKLVGDSE